MRRVLFILFLLYGYTAIAQLPYQLIGARTAGMGGAASAHPDVWATQNNIGALAGVQEISFSAGVQTRFNLPELSTSALAFAMPTPAGVAGGSVSRYGFGPYHLTEATVGFAHQIRLVSIGAGAGFVQSATSGFGSRLVPLLSLGGTAELLPKLRLGAYVYNITQSKLNVETGEYLPTLLRAGLQWTLNTQVLLVAETEKDVDFPARFKGGIQYLLRSSLALRTGISTHPINVHGGLGLYPGNFRFDYALEHHGHIGLMHHLSFGWLIRKKP
jgi:hypothetical protein